MASEEPETYLRLMAEAELRRALTLPRVRLHEVGRFPSKRMIMRALRPPRRRILSGWSTVSPVTRVASYVIRLLASRRDRQHEGAYDGLHRLSAAADALAAVDALDDDVARKVIADQQLALELRQRVFPDQLDYVGVIRRQRASAASGPPTGPFSAVGIAKRTAFEVQGDPAEVTLLALVIGPDRAVLTVTAKRHGEMDDDGDYDDGGFWFLDQAKAADNRGGRYSCDSSGGGDNEDWTGQLELRPVPPAGIQWLDLTFVPGTPPIRINVDDVPPPDPAIESLPRSELAERYLDRVAEQLFECQPEEDTSWCDGVTALLGAGLIPLDSPAISRLATLAKRLGACLPSGLADRPDTKLSDRWLSVLGSAGAMDGPVGIAAAAAVLPEFEGSRWAIAGLRSNQDSAEMDILGCGAGDGRSYEPPLDMTPRLSWWARDNTGRWHIASMSEESWGDTHSDFTLRFTPALHPGATSLDVVLTGQYGRVTVTLPLDWTPALDWTRA
jgi:hypothetical protein